MILHWSRNYLILVFYDDFLLGNHVPDAQPSEYSILPVAIQPYGGHGPWHIDNYRQDSRRSSPLRCNKHLEHSAVCNAPLASRIKHVLQCDTPINLRTIPRQSFYYSIFFKFLVYGNTAILETSWSYPALAGFNLKKAQHTHFLQINPTRTENTCQNIFSFRYPSQTFPRSSGLLYCFYSIYDIPNLSALVILLLVVYLKETPIRAQNIAWTQKCGCHFCQTKTILQSES